MDVALDMDAVLVNVTRLGDRQEPVVIMAEMHPAKFFAYNTYDFHTTPQADQLMQQLNAQADWTAFLIKLNAALKSSDQVAQNPRGLKLAEKFNSEAHLQGKLQGWKVTFYTRFTRSESGVNGGGDFDGNHYLVIEPQSSNRFYEKHVGRWGEWDRACCCKEAPETDCKFSWSGGKCCKFKYGDISKNGCKSGFWSKSLEKVDDASCQSGPDVPSFPGWKLAEFVD